VKSRSHPFNRSFGSRSSSLPFQSIRRQYLADLAALPRHRIRIRRAVPPQPRSQPRRPRPRLSTPPVAAHAVPLRPRARCPHATGVAPRTTAPEHRRRVPVLFATRAPPQPSRHSRAAPHASDLTLTLTLTLAVFSRVSISANVSVSAR
jgi:hypothetical protein